MQSSHEMSYEIAIDPIEAANLRASNELDQDTFLERYDELVLKTGEGLSNFETYLKGRLCEGVVIEEENIPKKKKEEP